MSRRRSLQALLGGFSVLVIGAVIGIMVDRFVLLAPPAEAQPAATLPGVAADHIEALADLARSLELSDAQTEHVHSVFMKHQSAIDQTWLAMRHHLMAVVDTVTAEIEVVLDPAQRQRLHAWIAERHGTAAQRAPAHGPRSAEIR